MCFSGLVVFFAPVIFFIPAVILVFFLILEVPHIFGRLVSKVWVLLDIVGNCSAKDVQNLFVGFLAVDRPGICS